MSSIATEIYLGSIMEARKLREPDQTTPFMALPIIDSSDIDSPDQSKRDALSIWTNDVFLFTLHRAVNSSGKERFSISFFGANHDALMETLPSCVTETRPRKYQSVTAGQHYINKMNHLYERVVPVKS